ncbi:beta-ketoacyl-[acyl-carrier-protein] synthase family protein [Streptomyces sp. NBC_00452]|uniref:beta-ketoacyl-[acyl-carrier-protein] synthase family protein n=1 Tax=Streptomyces sp. NBC_00452 TaxID=2975746 RepID=UPI0022593068|nr:beta-ketoacyl synthase N-terminal-like domain-containing protein [Streptomyces sp. NBC_00452]MCX5055821.1 beta-ketoacyl-[acyl-carrier-protein] synthase family protein [Streptomyces sp. NBC_00452]
MPPPDVVITGLGVVSPLGHDLGSFWTGLLRGEVPARPLTFPGAAMPGAVAYLVEDVPDTDGIAAPPVPGRALGGPAGGTPLGGRAPSAAHAVDGASGDLAGPGTASGGGAPPAACAPVPAAPSHAPASQRLGRASTFALAAARDALADAGLGARGPGELADVGLCVATGNGDSDLLEARRDGRREGTGLDWYPYNTLGLLSHRLGLYGPGLTISTACAAGAYAVAVGAEAIAAGETDVVLVGGAEAVSRPAVGAFLRLGAGDPEHCRPFDADRAGAVYGEGAAFLVLESAEHAAARGRAPYARVLSSGWSCDAFHVTAPDPEGTQSLRAVHDALDRGGIAPDSIGAVLAHGTGTPANDAVESRVTAQVLGDRTPDVPVTAVKASLGHSGGAAGAFACLTAALVVRHGLVPPVGTLRRLDPACALRVVRGAPEVSAAETVLVNAYAFGGNNISVAVGAAGIRGEGGV